MGKCRYDLSEDCHNKDCLKCVLDKIRAEIEEKADGSVGEIADGLYDALEIIDKYKAESEVEDGNDIHDR